LNSFIHSQVDANLGPMMYDVRRMRCDCLDAAAQLVHP